MCMGIESSIPEAMKLFVSKICLHCIYDLNFIVSSGHRRPIWTLNKQVRRFTRLGQPNSMGTLSVQHEKQADERESERERRQIQHKYLLNEHLAIGLFTF